MLLWPICSPSHLHLRKKEIFEEGTWCRDWAMSPRQWNVLHSEESLVLLAVADVTLNQIQEQKIFSGAKNGGLLWTGVSDLHFNLSLSFCPHTRQLSSGTLDESSVPLVFVFVSSLQWRDFSRHIQWSRLASFHLRVPGLRVGGHPPVCGCQTPACVCIMPSLTTLSCGLRSSSRRSEEKFIFPRRLAIQFEWILAFSFLLLPDLFLTF